MYMKGGKIVNVFSQFIQQKSTEQNKPYDVVLKNFWKNKKLQKEWKTYKSGLMKDIFVPQKRPVQIQYPIHPYTASMDYKPNEETPTPEETKESRTWENTFKGRTLLTDLEDVAEEMEELINPPPTPNKPKKVSKKRELIIEDEDADVVEEEFPRGLPDLDAPLREWYQTPKRRIDELKRTEEKLVELYKKRDDPSYSQSTMEQRKKLNLEINYWYDRQKELIGLLLETEPSVETVNIMGKPVVMTREGSSVPFSSPIIKKRRIEGTGVSFLTRLANLRNKIIKGEGLYKVQSVLFSKDKWSNPSKASEWLKSHSYLDKGVDEKEETYRFRQMNPDYVRKQGFKQFVTKPLGDSGVSLILAYK